MTPSRFSTVAPHMRLVALCLAAVMAASSAMAAKPDGEGPPFKKKHHGAAHAQNEQQEHGPQRGKAAKPGKATAPAPAALAVGGYFQGNQRNLAQSYYHQQFSTGHCPPGLAKKHNGCMPPGQARKWAVGRPLPRDVVYYPVPPALVVQLGAPPSGYRYVRVATDILLIAVGTSMVIDAIDDLGRL